MYNDNLPLAEKLKFWFEDPAMYFVPDLPPNIEAAIIHVVRQELKRAETEKAFFRRMRRPWWKLW